MPNDHEKPQIEKLTYDLSENINLIRWGTGHSEDIIVRTVNVGSSRLKGALIYTDGLTNDHLLQTAVIEPLMREGATVVNDYHTIDHILRALHENVLYMTEYAYEKKIDDIVTALLSGDTVFLLEGLDECSLIASKQWDERGVEEASTQTVVRGPKEAFSESLKSNVALVRRKINDSDLTVKYHHVGNRTKTKIAVIFINSLCEKTIVEEITTRIENIDEESILESGHIEKKIQDEPYSPFPTVYNSERPDNISAGLLKGRIAILIDGTPFVLLVPALFDHFFRSMEDDYQRLDITIFIRFIRYIAFIQALLIPSLFIAITTFHQEMLPTQLLFSLAAQREGTPFPTIVEALAMEFTFEILREAGIRMPRAIGSAISIVGALVIGQAAVEAGFVSGGMVIVVSLTAICSFVSPSYSIGIAARLLRFVFMVLASFLGLYGVLLGLVILTLHLCSLRSFSVLYLQLPMLSKLKKKGKGSSEQGQQKQQPAVEGGS
ncbi:spore germination protein [Salipaludibacillus sp. LMS25]|uniref:spore germination protein n=1 Tax=Salipaludibacillus sp. LMS25 TaxID=2924031 RepID=UPI0020D01694|nr:spore germination protein [Salipaludibacillus sp. LMS25]UTR15299.1 spore germination protein [Salipaludibacillus sp. LMS25]